MNYSPVPIQYHCHISDCYKNVITKCVICENDCCKIHSQKCKCKICNVYTCSDYNCFERHLDECLPTKVVRQDDKINNEIKEMREEIDEIKNAINTINERLLELFYAPNGIMYQEAKSDFESRKTDK